MTEASRLRARINYLKERMNYVDKDTVALLELELELNLLSRPGNYYIEK